MHASMHAQINSAKAEAVAKAGREAKQKANAQKRVAQKENTLEHMIDPSIF